MQKLKATSCAVTIQFSHSCAFSLSLYLRDDKLQEPYRKKGGFMKSEVQILIFLYFL